MCRDADVKRLHREGTTEKGQGETRGRKTKQE